MITLIFLETDNMLVIGLLVGLVAFFVVFGLVKLYNKNYKKPVLSIKLNTEKKWTREKHFRGEDHDDTHQDFHGVHLFFNIIWNFEILLLNVSKVNAYGIKLLQLKEFKGLQYSKGKIDNNLILKEDDKEMIPISFNKKVRVIREDGDKYYTVYPEEFNDLVILMEYKGKNNKLFYRKYYFKGDKMKDCSLSELDLDQWAYI